MIVYPAIDPVAIAIGPVKVHWYGLMYVLGFIAGWWLARRRAAQPGSTWKPADVDDLIFFAAVGVIAGGRLGWMLFYGLDSLRADPLAFLRVWEGGMSFHGGLIGVMMAVAWFARRRGRRVADVFDFTAPLPAVGLCAGRIGNFINGELWGRPTELPWGMLVDGRGPASVAALRSGPGGRRSVRRSSGGSPRGRGRGSRRLACSSRSMPYSAWPWSSCACRMPTSGTSRSGG